MSFRSKLLLAQLPLGVALALVGWAAISNVGWLGQQSAVILDENYRSVLAAQRIHAAIEHLQQEALREALGVTTAPESSAARSREVENELRALEGNLTEPGEEQTVAELRRRWETYHTQLGALDGLEDEGERRARIDRLEAAVGAARKQTQLVLDMNQDAMVRKSGQAQRAARDSGTFMMAAAAAALLIGALLSGLLIRRFLQPFELLARTVVHLREGDFDTRVNVQGSDEVARLAHEVNAMATHLGQYRRSSLGELLLAQEASQAAIDSLPDPVIVFDLNGDVLIVNRAAESLLGVHFQSGGDALAEVPAAVRTCIEQVRTHVLSGKGAYVPRGFEEAVRIEAAGTEQYLLPRATPVRSSEGSIAGTSVLLQDVTRLRRVDDLRNNLVATVAHEFRTPLTSLGMAIHLCLNNAGGPLTEKQADLLYAAREECERLQALVEELLDLARIQSGRMELHRKPSPPAALIDAAIDANRAGAVERQLILDQEVDPRCTDVLVDRERIQLVLANLLTNAIRHTPAGGSIVVRARPAEGERVRFDVADNGPGIPPDYRSSIFEKFVRIPGTPGGSGLGLSIAREIIDAHSGTIGVEETPGGGATFWFMLPTVATTEHPT